MALNPNYEAIGKGFVQQYYALFDDPAQRPNLMNLYNVSGVRISIILVLRYLGFYVYMGTLSRFEREFDSSSC